MGTVTPRLAPRPAAAAGTDADNSTRRTKGFMAGPSYRSAPATDQTCYSPRGRFTSSRPVNSLAVAPRVSAPPPAPTLPGQPRPAARSPFIVTPGFDAFFFFGSVASVLLAWLASSTFKVGGFAILAAV